jgi:hypothetical protein
MSGLATRLFPVYDPADAELPFLGNMFFQLSPQSGRELTSLPFEGKAEFESSGWKGIAKEKDGFSTKD